MTLLCWKDGVWGWGLQMNKLYNYQKMSVEMELNVVKLVRKHHLPKSSICTSFPWQRCTPRCLG